MILAALLVGVSVGILSTVLTAGITLYLGKRLGLWKVQE